MKRLKLLAALTAAGLMTFAAHSQEAPFNAAAGNPAAFANEGQPTGTETTVGFTDRGQVQVNATKGAATSKVRSLEATGAAGGNGIRPEVVATAHKTTVVTSSEKAAVLKGSKPEASGRYHEIIARYASAYGVPTSLAHAIIRHESNYRATARGRAGEIGLMQIKHSTARGMGYTGSAKGLYDPETNIKFGMKYLGLAHKLGGGKTCGTILRYNAGHGAKRMNPTSASYCAKVKRMLGSA